MRHWKKGLIFQSEEEREMDYKSREGRELERDRVQIAVWIPKGWPVIIKPLWLVCTFPQILLSHAQ